MGLLISADVARVLAVTLNGRELARYYVAEQADDDDVLDALGLRLVDGIAARIGPDQPLDPGPLDEPDDGTSSIRQPIKSPAVSVKPAITDTQALDVAVSDTAELQRRGEAERGHATDATVRAWARQHDVPCSTHGKLNAWVRAEYERLRGAPPDYNTRRLARQNGAGLTLPSVAPAGAHRDTVLTWAARNGVQDTGAIELWATTRELYAQAWAAAHPDHKPPAASVSPSGEDPPASGERAGRAAPPGAGAVNGSVRPAIEPIGDGNGQPPSSPEQLARADELAADGRTPRQICSEAGVWLSEARAAVRKATER